MSKKKKPINFIVPLVVYPFDTIVSIGESDADLRRSLKKRGIAWDDILFYEGVGRCVLLPNNTVVIRIYRFPFSPADHGTLSHEIFHAVDFILRDIGMSLLKESGEAYAYLIGYLTKEIYKKI
jgi:hypothetical protein